ncbi:hypothetical protein [Streptomyces sp. SID11385]|uniref:hypothetical protein n=1 Tax=Streptomyces sp. SID11385 TaxID=2706031 RepID=UPI0013C75BDA|nr:hypothetical protein [Streptomyces sp. SID11385]NEA41451.1 hypothetical protein [Streptomyces sp. SID11385]
MQNQQIRQWTWRISGIVLALAAGTLYALVDAYLGGSPYAILALPGLAFCLVWIAVKVRGAYDRRILASRERLQEAEAALVAVLRAPRRRTAPNELGAQWGESTAGRENGTAADSQEVSQSTLALASLWNVTHERLALYHGIAQGQARRSFISAQVSMAVGAVLLVVFVVIGLRTDTTAAAVVAGTLGVASAALAGYVSRTFVRSQEVSAGHLRSYFDQPLEFSRYLAAERLIADSGLPEDKRAEIITTLVQAMIAGPASPPTAGPEAASENPPG